MVYIRGDQAQYDAWETLGNKGWNWNSLATKAGTGIPSSRMPKGEHFTPPTDAQKTAGASYDPIAHGTDGPLLCGFPFVLSNSSFFSKARDTWNALGVPHIRDLNGGHTRGFVTAPMTVDRDVQVREDSSRAYYTPIEGRKNLKMIKGTVRRIVWGDDAGGKPLLGVLNMSVLRVSWCRSELGRRLSFRRARPQHHRYALQSQQAPRRRPHSLRHPANRARRVRQRYLAPRILDAHQALRWV
jgi:hypothetical protein